MNGSYLPVTANRTTGSRSDTYMAAMHGRRGRRQAVCVKSVPGRELNDGGARGAGAQRSTGDERAESISGATLRSSRTDDVLDVDDTRSAL